MPTIFKARTPIRRLNRRIVLGPAYVAWLVVLFSGPVVLLADEPAAGSKSIRVGIIGLDTSHAIAFTTILNAENPGPEFSNCRVVAAYPNGSADIRSSVERIPAYTEQIRGLGVEIVDSIDALLTRVDAVLLETNDGRPHLDQALPVFKAHKRLFIDKPMAASLADVIAIFELARKYDTPVFSCSALRYGPNTMAAASGAVGEILGCDTYSPCGLEPTHPDLCWYGIHGVESLFTVLGSDCLSVSRVAEADSDMAIGRWSGGRIGTFRGMRTGAQQYGGTVFGSQGNASVGEYAGYAPLVADIVKFFRGAEPTVSEQETVAMFAFMEGADESKKLGGQPVSIETIIKRARELAQKRISGR
jgi:predicted dehydrogenase